MINKRGVVPTFTTKINIVYNKDFSLKDFYSSLIMDDQLSELQFNGEKDSVTLIPVPGRYNKAPKMQVQVMKRFKDGIAYDTQEIHEPTELHSAYEKALENINSGNKEYARKSACGLDYMV